MEAMKADTGLSMEALRVDGGASANNFLMQFQADMLDCPVLRPEIRETTALGAAYLAGLACGFWKDREDIVKNRGVDRVFSPQMSVDLREKLLNGWHKAVKCSFGWASE